MGLRRALLLRSRPRGSPTGVPASLQFPPRPHRATRCLTRRPRTQPAWTVHLALLPQRAPLVHGHVVGLVAVDLVLWLLRTAATHPALELHVLRVHGADHAADHPGLGVPLDVVTHREVAHAGQYAPVTPGRVTGRGPSA